jgi:hypothetical protein
MAYFLKYFHRSPFRASLCLAPITTAALLMNSALAWCSSLTFRFVKPYIGPAASEYFLSFFIPRTKLASGAESSRV